MTQTQCPCGATTDAPLCRDCTRELADTLKRLPGLVDDLLTSATKQARLDQPSHIEVQLPPEWSQADAEQAKIPPRLRSEYSRIALPATRLPVAFGAAQLHRQAVAGVADWLARIEADPLPDRPIRHVQTAVVIRLNRAWTVRTHVQRAAIEPATYAAWLAGHAERFRQSEHGPEVHAKALELAAAIEATVDRRSPDVFAGRCDATGVRIDRLTVAGPTCGLHCRHASCTLIRSRHSWLSPVIGECGEPLTAPAGSTAVTCPACGTEYDVTAQRAKIADTVADQLGTVREVTGFLRTLTVTVAGGEERQLDVTVDKVDGWLRRGRITDHGAGPRGRLVKVGEVRAYAEQLAGRGRPKTGT